MRARKSELANGGAVTRSDNDFLSAIFVIASDNGSFPRLFQATVLLEGNASPIDPITCRGDAVGRYPHAGAPPEVPSLPCRGRGWGVAFTPLIDSPFNPE